MAGTARRRIRPRLINQPMPEWATRLLETGEQPAPDSPDADQFFGWAFLNEVVVGLPPADELLWSGALDASKPRRRL
jgi:hypothetical protein